jgi:hypothetical protein
MPDLSTGEAVERLARAFGPMDPDDLREAFGELFPEESATGGGEGGEAAIRERVVDRLRSGLEPEEIVDLWNVVFPQDRNVFYDDEAERICFERASESIR